MTKFHCQEDLEGAVACLSPCLMSAREEAVSALPCAPVEDLSPSMMGTWQIFS